MRSIMEQEKKKRAQLAGRSETGKEKILTVKPSETLTISSSGTAKRTLTTAQSERTRKREKQTEESERGSPKGVYKPFGWKIKLIRAQGGCPGTDCRRRT